MPTITVMTPVMQSVQTVISANGSIAARREMPVGVVGEGGEVVRVLVEPGQWVGAGQTLAIIDRTVQAQQAASLAASIRVAQADADLAQSERSEEHTSELQSLMRISYAVFCLKKKKEKNTLRHTMNE